MTSRGPTAGRTLTPWSDSLNLRPAYAFKRLEILNGLRTMRRSVGTNLTTVILSS